MDKITQPFLNRYFAADEMAKIKERKLFEVYSHDGLTFVRLTGDFKGYLRGAVFHEEGYIPGYPRIMRILHLKNGIFRYFKGDFYVEEKVDGYNIRIATIKGIPLAFTRGGFICPFTTDRVEGLIDLNFFKKYPDHLICGEVVGPGSPYNIEVIPYIKEDIIFYAFDLINERDERLSLEDRYKTLEEFNIPQVRRWGPFKASDIEAVKEIVLELDREGREGIVIKPLSNGKSAKYVTISSCLRDMQATAHLMSELPSGFFVQRIMRAVFFCHEFAMPFSNEYLTDSAQALYLMPRRALRDIEDGGSIKETFNIRVKNKRSVDALMQHLNRSGIMSHLLSLERDEGYYRARFQRIYLKGTRELRQRLMGKGFFD